MPPRDNSLCVATLGGVWQVQIQGVKGVQSVKAENIMEHRHGFFFYHPPASEAHEGRWSFVPHHRIERMWQSDLDGSGK